MIKKIRGNENIVGMISPFKFLGYNQKKIEIEQKNEAIISNNSKNIDERKFKVDNNNDEEDHNKTPRKTTDKVKIFPCKLISEISKKYN